MVTLHARVTFGAAGAPTLDLPNSAGIASISRLSAGAYSIRLTQAYNRLYEVKRTVVRSAPSAAPETVVFLNSVSVLADPLVTVLFSNAGTPTDPASGEEALFTIVLNKSSV